MNPKTVLVYFATILFPTVLFVAEASQEFGGPVITEDKDEPEQDDVQREGEFTLKSKVNDPNFLKYLEVMEYSAQIREAVTKTKKFLITIKKLDAARYNIKSTTDLKTWEMTFESGKEFEFERPDGRKVKNTFTLSKNDKSLNRVIKMDGFDATADAVFNQNGFTLTLRAKDVVATLDFEQVKGGDELSGRDWRDIIWSWG